MESDKMRFLDKRTYELSPQLLLFLHCGGIQCFLQRICSSTEFRIARIIRPLVWSLGQINLSCRHVAGGCNFLNRKCQHSSSAQQYCSSRLIAGCRPSCSLSNTNRIQKGKVSFQAITTLTCLGHLTSASRLSLLVVVADVCKCQITLLTEPKNHICLCQTDPLSQHEIIQSVMYCSTAPQFAQCAVSC